MGKLMNYLSMIIAIDILFLITGQTTSTSPTSIIINAILNPSNITTSSWYILLITGGISLLTLGAAVVVGFVSKSFELVIFVPMAIALAALVGDFVSVYVYLASINKILATAIMSPVIILFLMTIVEWLRGKD